jgi:hypothetical protein
VCQYSLQKLGPPNAPPSTAPFDRKSIRISGSGSPAGDRVQQASCTILRADVFQPARAFLMSYKRNQIEEAITKIVAPDSKRPPLHLRTRLKRLLDLDRSTGRDVGAAKEANFAFFSKAPGTGAVIPFSEYEAFALLNGLRVLEHGWPQASAVSIMRQVRSDLEKEHRRILSQPEEELFGQQAILERARAGDIAVDNTDPVYLAVVSSTLRDHEASAAPVPAVCRGWASVNKFSRDLGASSVTMFEVATLAHRLHRALIRTKPRHRGRG